jgi:hypothetical protein
MMLNIKKNKIDKDNFRKIITKKIEKNFVEKHYSNPQCFVRKATLLSPHDLALLIITYNC